MSNQAPANAKKFSDAEWRAMRELVDRMLAQEARRMVAMKMQAATASLSERQ